MKNNLLYEYGNHDETNILFKCDCADIDHNLVVEKYSFDYGYIKSIDQLNFLFTASIHDSDNIKYAGGVMRFIYRLKWRIKCAYRVLKNGYITYQGVWSPARRYGESTFGISETRRFIKTISDALDTMENNSSNFAIDWTPEMKRKFEQHLADSWGYKKDADELKNA